MFIVKLFLIVICIIFTIPPVAYVNDAWGQNDAANLQTITHLSLKETEGTDLSWELLADKAIIDKKKQLISLDKLNLTYQLITGEKVQLTGDFGTANLSRNKITIRGNIKGNSNEGINLETEALVWDAKNRIITTHNPIYITRSDIRFSGEELRADIALKKISIKKNVKTTIY